MTDLDTAFAAMEAAPSDDAARLGYFERLADGELFILLEAEPQGEAIRPQIFETDGHRFALVFDRPQRLADFAERETAFVAMSGRALAQMLRGQGIGLALNLGAPSANLLPADAVEWLADLLDETPDETQGEITMVHPPRALPQDVLVGLDRKLALMAGRAAHAWLVDAEYANGARVPLLVFVDAAPGAEGALSAAVREALVFSGIDAAALDVGFVARSDALAAQLARQGLRFDLPKPATGEDTRPAPGSDPSKPPILR